MTVASFGWYALVLPEVIYGEPEAAERCSGELVAYCDEKKVVHYQLLGAIGHAHARAMRESTPENVALLREAIDCRHRAGAHSMNSLFACQLTEALLAVGDVTGAETAVREGLTFVEQSGERLWLSGLHRLNGVIALKRPEPDCRRAEACFLQAIEIAHQQEARMLELRAATDLARLWRDIGSDGDLRALLGPILDAIEGGETTRDVRNARALLAELV
jgi:predicted ATPase